MRSTPILAGALLVLAACTDRGLAPTDPQNVTSIAAPSLNIVSETSTDLWARIVTGETGPGSMYRLYLPRTWNGTAVFYSHGIRDVLEPLSLKNQDNLEAIRDQLGALGYAVAYSSYSENGYAEKDGAQRTHQLLGLFTSAFGAPTRSLLVGHSLGGLISLDLAERFSSQYDGVVAFCGIAGGTQAEIDHAVNVRMLFDMFYPGVLPGSFDNPPGIVPDPATIVAAVTANPNGLLMMANVAQAGLEFHPASVIPTLMQSLITALTFHSRGRDNVLQLVNGFPFDNTQTVYSAAVDNFLPPNVIAAGLAQINAGAPRTAGSESALNYTARNFTPSGALSIPTITLHNRWDPLVPFFHEGMFASRVTAAGANGLLLQRTKFAYGHCNFTVPEQVQAVTDLASWIESGIKPNN